MTMASNPTIMGIRAAVMGTFGSHWVGPPFPKRRDLTPPGFVIRPPSWFGSCHKCHQCHSSQGAKPCKHVSELEKAIPQMVGITSPIIGTSKPKAGDVP